MHATIDSIVSERADDYFDSRVKSAVFYTPIIRGIKIELGGEIGYDIVGKIYSKTEVLRRYDPLESISLRTDPEVITVKALDDKGYLGVVVGEEGAILNFSPDPDPKKARNKFVEPGSVLLFCEPDTPLYNKETNGLMVVSPEAIEKNYDISPASLLGTGVRSLGSGWGSGGARLKDYLPS